jgi:hypothetical protein
MALQTTVFKNKLLCSDHVYCGHDFQMLNTVYTYFTVLKQLYDE